jgi:hypothetical protein
MCDYSLHAVRTRDAVREETIILTSFEGTMTKGFATESEPDCAVCMKLGTEVQVGDSVAKFIKVNEEIQHQHHDALEFVDGRVVLVNDLAVGTRATVIQLPAPPIKEAEQREHSEEVIVPTEDYAYID